MNPNPVSVFLRRRNGTPPRSPAPHSDAALRRLHRFLLRKKAQGLGLRLLFCLLLFVSLRASRFSLAALIDGAPAMGQLLARMLHPDFSQMGEVLPALCETFELAFLGSALGLFLALPAVYLTSARLAPCKSLALLLNFFFAFLRTLPSLVHAALLVALFSVGRFAGLLALAMIALLMAQKLLRERVDALPESLLLSFRSLGVTKAQLLLRAVLPALSDDLFSVFFLIIESNIRSASVLGFVGAGGIGQLLWQDLSHLRYDRIAGILILIFLSILALDTLSSLCRRLQKKIRFSPKSLRSKRRSLRLAFFLKGLSLLALFYVSASFLSIRRERLIAGLFQFGKILRRFCAADLSYLPKVFSALAETFFIALSSTLLASILALLFAYLAADTERRRLRSPLFKALLNLLRSFPPMISAIVFFRAVGPGPMAGVLSLTLYTTAVLGKLFYEFLENLPPSFAESAGCGGLSPLVRYRFAVLPQCRDSYLSLCLYRFESNLRNSTLLGIVGAGGIGQLISMSLRVRAYEKAGILILSLVLLVFSLERMSSFLQKKLR